MVFALLKNNWPQYERCVERQRLAWLKCVKCNYLGQKELLLQEEKVRCLWKRWIVVFCSLSILSFWVSLLSRGVIQLAAAGKTNLAFSETLQNEVVHYFLLLGVVWSTCCRCSLQLRKFSKYLSAPNWQKHAGKRSLRSHAEYLSPAPVWWLGEIWPSSYGLAPRLWVATYPFLRSSSGLTSAMVCSRDRVGAGQGHG